MLSSHLARGEIASFDWNSRSAWIGQYPMPSPPQQQQNAPDSMEHGMDLANDDRWKSPPHSSTRTKEA